MALKALRGQPTRFVTIISADHFSEAPARFQKFFCLVKKEALRYPDQLFLAGSLPESFPTKSHSKFGWISVKKAIGARSNSVKSFAEKPSGVRLNRIRKNGGLINSGMFFGQLETFNRAYEELFPNALDKQFRHSQLPKIPIDKVIFEKFKKVRCVPLRERWVDLGSWSELARQGMGDESTTVEGRGNFFWSTEKMQAFFFGVKDLAVVKVGSRIMIVPLSKAESRVLDRSRGRGSNYLERS